MPVSQFTNAIGSVLVDYWHFGLGQGPALLEDLVVNNSSAVVVVESIYRFSLDKLDFFFRVLGITAIFLSLIHTNASAKEGVHLKIKFYVVGSLITKNRYVNIVFSLEPSTSNFYVRPRPRIFRTLAVRPPSILFVYVKRILNF